ncbi:hypothetical protein RFI_09016 [Reticulomyxa filosa]|uniref:Uncharacterized protein n=1 Tax=Reticulomyxa filosa TaxID=46433 RepID=X6NS00_RETFI|nr:hypothetical protein RFI_09016 [Reticulomyxa filosa]|eukprot:ETO28117.1 hypothetical protein RFI_09016 [Reticulomyxa filosa]
MIGMHRKRSGDDDNDKGSKKLSGIVPPWATKTGGLRPEMEAADGYGEQEKNGGFMARQEQQQVCDGIHILNLQLQRSEQTVDEMTTCDLKCKMLTSELDKTKDKNEQLTKNIKLKEAQLQQIKLFDSTNINAQPQPQPHNAGMDSHMINGSTIDFNHHDIATNHSSIDISTPFTNDMPKLERKEYDEKVSKAHAYGPFGL